MNTVSEIINKDVTILLVDDEQAILEMTLSMLVHQKYTVISAVSPLTAVQLSEVSPLSINLLISDINMPGMNGIDMAFIVMKKHPRMKCLFTSGDPANARKIINKHPSFSFIHKPYPMFEFLDTVHELVQNQKVEI